jgi:hypothetical protein
LNNHFVVDKKVALSLHQQKNENRSFNIIGTTSNMMLSAEERGMPG